MTHPPVAAGRIELRDCGEVRVDGEPFFRAATPAEANACVLSLETLGRWRDVVPPAEPGGRRKMLGSRAAAPQPPTTKQENQDEQDNGNPDSDSQHS